MQFDLTRRLAAEALGTLILGMAVIGSGIMAENLAGGNQAVALLCNTIATGGCPMPSAPIPCSMASALAAHSIGMILTQWRSRRASSIRGW